MLEQSGVLTLLGMGIVFGFLFLVIISVTVVGKIIHAIGADKDLLESPKPAASTVKPAANNAAVTAAITTAVNEYQKTH
jgi:oxaloacetate decarboxylase gamma subunit